MNWSHFGLTRRPFRPAVDTASYFPAATHEAALVVIAAAFARRDPVVLLDGPPGTGKSLVARKWLESLAPAIQKVVLPNAPAARPAELLQAILFDLNQPYQGLSEQELRLAVTAQLLAASEASSPTVLLIDEAQHLGPPALEELRLLGNVEVGGSSALFVLLAAQPGLGDRFDGTLAQRVAVRCGLEPLTLDESAGYLRHQIRAAGGDPAALFDDDAVALLGGACGGVPRVLNQAAGLALDLAAWSGADLVDVEAAMEAVARLGLDARTDEPALLPHPSTTDEPARSAQTARNRRAASNRDQPVGGTTPKQKPGRKRPA